MRLESTKSPLVRWRYASGVHQIPLSAVAPMRFGVYIYGKPFAGFSISTHQRGVLGHRNA